MKRVIMPVFMLAAMMQLNGAASRASALWSTARTSGLLRPTGQRVFTAGRTTLPQGFVCPAGSRLLSSGSPSTAFRTSGRFGALGKPSAPHAEEGYWSRFKRFLVPTGTAAVAAGAYVASQEGEEEPLALRLPRGYAADEDVEMARAYYAGREKGAIKARQLTNAVEKEEKLWKELEQFEASRAPKAVMDEARNKWSEAYNERKKIERDANPIKSQYESGKQKIQPRSRFDYRKADEARARYVQRRPRRPLRSEYRRAEEETRRIAKARYKVSENRRQISKIARELDTLEKRIVEK